MTNRIESLDWLRGLMAIFIMFYHLIYWHFTPLGSSCFLGRIGVYGVSIFFVLSGLSMAIVYSKFIVDKRTSIVFYVRRIFRIWPLLWACVIFAIIPIVIAGGEVSLMKVFMNLTTLFGFISPSSYINTGAWSIGNEMVYYAFTPIIIILYEKSRTQGNIILLISFIVALIFAFFLLDPHKTLSEEWTTYINPFNNIFLYVAGISIYYNLNNIDIKTPTLLMILVISIAIFFFYPVEGDKIAIVTGINRIIFLFASIILVVFFYKFSSYDIIPKNIQYPLEQFGIATYGVYLLHPIVNNYAGTILKKVAIESSLLQFAVVVIITIVIAVVSFNLFERKIMKFGKKVTSKDSSLWKSLDNFSSTSRSN